MLPNGRGAIAHVQYTGDEAAGEIKKLLDAVVSTTQPHKIAYADSIADRERGRLREVGSARHARFRPRGRRNAQLESLGHRARAQRLRLLPYKVPALLRILEEVRRSRVLDWRHRDGRDGTFSSSDRVAVKLMKTRCTSAASPASHPLSTCGPTTAPSRSTRRTTTTSFESKSCLSSPVQQLRSRPSTQPALCGMAEFVHV
jgi:hypothetical protein